MACQWICLFARSGVEVPISTFMEFSQLASSFDISLLDGLELAMAGLSSAWLKQAFEVAHFTEDKPKSWVPGPRGCSCG